MPPSFHTHVMVTSSSAFNGTVEEAVSAKVKDNEDALRQFQNIRTNTEFTVKLTTACSEVAATSDPQQFEDVKKARREVLLPFLRVTGGQVPMSSME